MSLATKCTNCHGRGYVEFWAGVRVLIAERCVVCAGKGYALAKAEGR